MKLFKFIPLFLFLQFKLKIYLNLFYFSGEIAMEWEDRLMEEMCRLTHELEQVHLDERNSALNKLKAEHLIEIQAMTTKLKQDEQKLLDDVTLQVPGVITE